MDTSGTWEFLKTKDEIKIVEGYENADVVRGTWSGVGWYYLTWGSQRCPRNCCYDTVLEYESAADHAEAVRQHIQEMAAHLRESRGKVT